MDGAIHVNVTGKFVCCGTPPEVIVDSIRRAVLTAVEVQP